MTPSVTQSHRLSPSVCRARGGGGVPTNWKQVSRILSGDVVLLSIAPFESGELGERVTARKRRSQETDVTVIGGGGFSHQRLQFCCPRLDMPISVDESKAPRALDFPPAGCEDEEEEEEDNTC